ncbi:hypothetical protein OAO87_02570 [bacterium]|nr:hypothetical protein [bacterium]
MAASAPATTRQQRSKRSPIAAERARGFTVEDRRGNAAWRRARAMAGSCARSRARAAAGYCQCHSMGAMVVYSADAHRGCVRCWTLFAVSVSVTKSSLIAASSAAMRSSFADETCETALPKAALSQPASEVDSACCFGPDAATWVTSPFHK